ncbi:hypothetical protein W01_04860 [Candidatus Nitrotoga sp. AM1P]|nr:hypothetical protein W01_04860 [Candidatus Nitrotoga sp. AM1P]
MLLTEIFGDRVGQGLCPFFGSVGTDLHCDQDSEDVEKHNDTKDIQILLT